MPWISFSFLKLYTVYSIQPHKPETPPLISFSSYKLVAAKNFFNILSQNLSPFSDAFDNFHICAFSRVLAISGTKAELHFLLWETAISFLFFYSNTYLNKLHKITRNYTRRKLNFRNVPLIRRKCLIYIQMRLIWGIHFFGNQFFRWKIICVGVSISCIKYICSYGCRKPIHRRLPLIGHICYIYIKRVQKGGQTLFSLLFLNESNIWQDVISCVKIIL